MMKNTVRSAALAAMLLLVVAPCWASWAVCPVAPLDRLLTNVAHRVALHPNDGAAQYVLGRLHSLAFAGNTLVDVEPDPKNWYKVNLKALPEFAGYDSVLEVRQSRSDQLPAAAREHLMQSVTHYQQAAKLCPSNALYFLGLGWMLEQGAHYAPQSGPPPGFRSTGPALTPARIREEWRTLALAAYRRSYALSIKDDLKQRNFQLEAGDNDISREAGEGIIHLQDGLALTAAERSELSAIRAAIATMKSRTSGITPIIFPLHHPEPLSQLLQPGRAVTFDLAGDGGGTRWPWVGPETGILVWDPAGEGRITSGRQLFGSVSWWMFWQTGYQALAGLDDNGDGVLTGRELIGIAVWCDRNENGVCDPGEVQSLISLGIDRIAVTPGREDALSNIQGIHLSNGSFLPTYDWMPVPLAGDVPLARHTK